MAYLDADDVATSLNADINWESFASARHVCLVARQLALYCTQNNILCSSMPL